MNLRPILIFLALSAVWTSPPEARAQDNRLISTDQWEYVFIQRLQRRGLLLDLDPTALPYRTGDLRAALRRVDPDDLGRVERRWIRLLRKALPDADPDREEILVGGMVRAGLTATNNDRLDPMRPIDTSNSSLSAGDTRFYPDAAFTFFVEKGPWVAQAGLHHSVYHDRDPDGLDAFNRLMARGEDSYLGFHSRFASAYLGRFANHWGDGGEPALLVSDNPLPYDQLNLRLGGRRFTLHSIVGELDAALPNGQYTGRLGDLPADARASGIRRFLSAHRFNWRPSRHLTLSFMEATLYSSPGAGLSLKYLNPLQLFAFEVDNRPKNDENNGLLAGLLWANIDHLTFSGQLLLDDLDIMFSTGERGSLALTGALTYAGIGGLADAGARLEAVTARAYNTHQPEGRYIYLLRGLGTQFSDYVHVSAFADLYLDGLTPGLILTPQVHLLWQGQRDIRDFYPQADESVDTILDGIVERTLRPAIELYYQRDPRWWLRLNAGPNLVVNEGHVTGADATEIIALVSFGVRLSTVRVVGLDFE